MLAAANFTNHYSEQITYESEWTETTPAGVSWLNLLTAEPIPEETDDIESPCTSIRNNSASNCSSSSSVESCYVVLEIQRPRSADETPGKVNREEEEEDEEEEEEEMEEEIEELNFAQIKRDDHNICYEQFAISMTTEVPMEEYVVEYEQGHVSAIKEYAKVTEPVIIEVSNDILFEKAKTLSRFTKRMKAMSSVSTKEQHLSTSSDDDSFKIPKLKTLQKINEYHPTVISAVATEQQLPNSPSDSFHRSATSLDSIENKSPPLSPTRTRITTTFSNISSQRPLNSAQIPRPSPTMGTTTLIRTFAFDRTCMEKYGRDQEKKNEQIKVQTVSTPPTPTITETVPRQKTGLPSKIIKQPAPSPPSNNTLDCRSFTNTIPTPFYIGSEESTIDESEFEHPPSISRSTSISHGLSKKSSIIYSMKKYARTITSEYLSTINNNGNTFTEPKLLQVKYLDGRLPLKDEHAQKSFQKHQTISGSVASRLDRFGLTKMSSTQDLSSQTTSFNNSCRKRMLNRFRTLIENNTMESSQLPQSRPWQHKKITELFNEKKYKINR